MITDFEYLPLFFIVRCSEEAAIGSFYRYLSMQEKLPMASFVVRKDEMWAMTDYEEKGRKR